MITVLVADDEPNVRRALRMRLELEPDMVVAGEAGDGLAAVSAVEELRPDIVVMDVTMPRMDGIAATARIHSIAPLSRVIVLTLRDDAATRLQAQTAGAAAFFGKHQSPDELLTAIRSLAARKEAPCPTADAGCGV